MSAPTIILRAHFAAPPAARSRHRAQLETHNEQPATAFCETKPIRAQSSMPSNVTASTLAGTHPDPSGPIPSFSGHSPDPNRAFQDTRRTQTGHKSDTLPDPRKNGNSCGQPHLQAAPAQNLSARHIARSILPSGSPHTHRSPLVYARSFAYSIRTAIPQLLRAPRLSSSLRRSRLCASVPSCLCAFLIPTSLRTSTPASGCNTGPHGTRAGPGIASASGRHPRRAALLPQTSPRG